MDNESKLIFEKYSNIKEDVGMGHGTPKVVVVNYGTSDEEIEDAEHCEDAENGCTCRQCPECAQNAEDAETVYIQAGEEDTCSDDCDCKDEGEDDYDGELDMARAELLKAADYATKLFNHIGKLDSLEGWTASKITKAADYLSSVYHYMDYESLDANVEDDEC